jgi:hypothetical protein
VARFMYSLGYDLRHSFTMGITPGLVSALIRGGWLTKSYLAGGAAEERKREPRQADLDDAHGSHDRDRRHLDQGGSLRHEPDCLELQPDPSPWGLRSLMWLKEARARDSGINALSDVTQKPSA